MDSDKSLWALKPGIEFAKNARGDTIVKVSQYHQYLIDKDHFDDTFVRLDVESLTTQLEKILDNYHYIETRAERVAGLGGKGNRAGAVAEVLELIGVKP